MPKSKIEDLIRNATYLSEFSQNVPDEDLQGDRGKILPLLFQTIKAESNFNPDAKSSAGAEGLGQFMPETAKDYNISDRTDPQQSVKGSMNMLDDLMNKYGDQKGSHVLASSAYNAGSGNVAKAGNNVPNIAETRGYVNKIYGEGTDTAMRPELAMKSSADQGGPTVSESAGVKDIISQDMADESTSPSKKSSALNKILPLLLQFGVPTAVGAGMGAGSPMMGAGLGALMGFGSGTTGYLANKAAQNKTDTINKTTMAKASMESADKGAQRQLDQWKTLTTEQGDMERALLSATTDREKNAITEKLGMINAKISETGNKLKQLGIEVDVEKFNRTAGQKDREIDINERVQNTNVYDKLNKGILEENKNKFEQQDKTREQIRQERLANSTILKNFKDQQKTEKPNKELEVFDALNQVGVSVPSDLNDNASLNAFAQKILTLPSGADLPLGADGEPSLTDKLKNYFSKWINYQTLGAAGQSELPAEGLDMDKIKQFIQMYQTYQNKNK